MSELIDIIIELIEHVRDIDRSDYSRDELYDLSRKCEELKEKGFDEQ